MSDDTLRFLDAASVESPAGSLADLELCSRDNEAVGTVEGVLIDPPARCIRYFVVKSPGRSAQFLLNAETPVSMEEEPRVGRVESARADLELEPFDPGSVPAYSEDDALTAMFARPAA